MNRYYAVEGDVICPPILSQQSQEDEQWNMAVLYGPTVYAYSL